MHVGSKKESTLPNYLEYEDYQTTAGENQGTGEKKTKLNQRIRRFEDNSA